MRRIAEVCCPSADMVPTRDGTDDLVIRVLISADQRGRVAVCVGDV